MTRQGLQGNICAAALYCMQTLRHLLFPLPNPESHLLVLAGSLGPCPLSLVPVMSGLGMVLDSFPCLAFPVSGEDPFEGRNVPVKS